MAGNAARPMRLRMCVLKPLKIGLTLFYVVPGKMINSCVDAINAFIPHNFLKGISGHG